MEDLFEMYDYIENNKVSDIMDVLYHATHSCELKLGWIYLLEDDKIVDLLSCKIRVKNSAHNKLLIENYYKDCIV